MSQPPFPLELDEADDFVLRAADLVGRAIGGDTATANVSDLNKFLEFLELDQVTSEQLGQQSVTDKVRGDQRSEVELRTADAERRIADPSEQIPTFTQASGQTPASPESPLGRILGLSDITEPIVDREFAERQGRRLPGLAGDIAGPVLGAASELTTPPELAFMAATAGFGGAAAVGLRTLGRGGRVAAKFVEPLAKTFARAAAAELGIGTVGVLGAEAAGRAVPEDASTPVRIGAAVAGGLAAGTAAIVAPATGRRLLSEAGQLAVRGGAAVERAAEAVGRANVGNVLLPAAPDARQLARFDLPKELSGSKVNFQRKDIQFESDLDRALYIATSRSPSKRRSNFIELLTREGFDTPEKIRLAAAPVRDRVAALASQSDDVIAVSRVTAEDIPTSGQVTLEGRVVPAATEQDIADRLTKQSAFDIDAGRKRLTTEQIGQQGAEEQARFAAAEERAQNLFDEADGTPSRSPEQIIRESNDPVELTDLADQLELEVNDLAQRLDQIQLTSDTRANPIARFVSVLGVRAAGFGEGLTPRQALTLSGETIRLADGPATRAQGLTRAQKAAIGRGEAVGLSERRGGVFSAFTEKEIRDTAQRAWPTFYDGKPGSLIPFEALDQLDDLIVAANPQRYGAGQDAIFNVTADIEQVRSVRGRTAQIQSELNESMRLRDLAVEQLGESNIPSIEDLPAGTPETRSFRRAADIPEGPIPSQSSLDVRTGTSAGGVPLDVSPTHRQASIDSLPLGRDGMQPPRQPPLPGDDLPIPGPYSGRPRTLNDMVREARAMRGFTPEQRAAISQVQRPIDDVIYRVGDFDAVLDRMPEGGKLFEAARKVPGARRTIGLIEGTRINSDQPISRLAQQTSLFLETEKAKVRVAVMAWMNDAAPAFGFSRKTGLAEAVELSGAAPEGWKSIRTVNDIVDHPEHYILSPHQTDVLKIAQDMTTQGLRDSQRLGVDVVELTEDYWHRIVTKGPREADSGAQVRVAARKRGHTLERSFEDVEAGLKGDYEYEFDPAIVLTARMEATVELIGRANYRNKLNAFPGVQTPAERIPSQVTDDLNRARAIRDSKKDAMARPGGNRVHKMQELRESEADFIVAQSDLMRASRKAALPGTYEVRLPSGRIAPRELMDGIDRLTFTGGGSNTIEEIFRLVRSSLTTLDLSAGYIQGQLTFFRNNRAWWIAQHRSILSLVDDPHAYVAKNLDLITEGIDNGAINQPSEYLFARRGISSLPTRIPVVGNLLRASNRAFEWFIIVAQTELYRASRSRILKAGDAATMRQELISLGTAIRRGTGSESYAALGISPRQQTLEALTFFAARFMRATVGIMQTTVRGGEAGREARRMMGAMIAGATAITIGINYATTGRLPNFTNPEGSDYAKFRVGKSYFSAYGPFHSYFRTMARVGVQLEDRRFNDARREIGRFIKGKLGIPFRFAEVAMEVSQTGESRTFDGEVIDLSPGGALTFLADQAPIAASEVARGFAQGRPESALEIFGINAVGLADSTGLLMLDAARANGLDITSLDELNTNQRTEILNDPAIREQVFKNRLKRGGYTAALADIEAEEYTRAYGLQQKLFAGKYEDSKGRKLESRQALRAYVNDFYTLRAEMRRARQQARKDFNVEFDDQAQAEDPLELALQQYFVALDESITEFGNFDSGKFNEGLKALQAQWSESQIEFVEDYQDRRHYPEGTQSLLDMEKPSLKLIRRVWEQWTRATESGLIRNELIEHFQTQQ